MPMYLISKVGLTEAMKCAKLIERINRIAKAAGQPVTYAEGANHTQVHLAGKQTTIPRHSEINEHTARSILKYLEGES